MDDLDEGGACRSNDLRRSHYLICVSAGLSPMVAYMARHNDRIAPPQPMGS